MMTPEQSAAYVMGQAACLMAEIAGMQAANQHRLSLGHSIAYDEGAFQDAINNYQCHHNAAIGLFNEVNNR